MKRDQRALYQVSSDESLKEQAKGEAHLRNKTISAKNVSYQLGYNPNTNIFKSTEKVMHTKGNYKSENYKNFMLNSNKSNMFLSQWRNTSIGLASLITRRLSWVWIAVF